MVTFFLVAHKMKNLLIGAGSQISANSFLHETGEGLEFIGDFKISPTGTGKYR